MQNFVYIVGLAALCTKLFPSPNHVMNTIPQRYSREMSKFQSWAQSWGHDIFTRASLVYANGSIPLLDQPVTGVPKQKCSHYSITKDSTSPKTQCGFRSCHWKTCCPWKCQGKIDGWNQRLMKLPPTIGLGIWPSLRYSSTDWKTSFSALALPGCRPQKTNRTSEAFRPQKESSNTKIQAFQLFPLFPLFQLDDDHVVDFALLLGHSDNAQDSRQLEPQSACTFKKGRIIFTGKKSSVS